MSLFRRLPSLRKNRDEQDYSDDSAAGEFRTKGAIDGIVENNRIIIPDRLPKLKFRLLSHNGADGSAHATELSSDDVWASIFAMFPDICPEYVGTLYKELKKKYRAGLDEQHLVNAILEQGAYPKQQDPSGMLSWNSEDDDGAQKERSYLVSAKRLLQIDYPNVPSDYVKRMLRKKGSLYAAHLALHDAESRYPRDPNNRPYRRQTAKGYAPNHMPPIDDVRLDKTHRGMLMRELEAAREQRRISADQSGLADEWESDDLELSDGRENLECQCCYSDSREKRMISCTGPRAHFFCAKCMRRHAEAQIEVMEFELKCMVPGGCGGGYSKGRLNKILGPILSRKLADIQQQQDIQAAGIEGLHECPFCNFKAIPPPIDEDRQFSCQNPACRKVTCRLCNRESHVPMSCEEVEKDKHVPTRRRIEEAMSDAVIRRCPSKVCNTPIIKEDGCNKLRCPRCRKTMCYVCKEQIDSYDHFSDEGRCCPLYDDNIAVNRRHDVEAANARSRATQDALASDPELKEEHIEVQRQQQQQHRAMGRTRSAPILPRTPVTGGLEQLNQALAHPYASNITHVALDDSSEPAGGHDRLPVADSAGAKNLVWPIAEPPISTAVTYQPPSGNPAGGGPGSYRPPWPTANPPNSGPGTYQPPWPTANPTRSMAYQHLNTGRGLAHWYNPRNTVAASYHHGHGDHRTLWRRRGAVADENTRQHSTYQGLSGYAEHQMKSNYLVAPGGSSYSSQRNPGSSE